jgi:uncharacterized RDD family membrane protein YckC
MSTGPWFYVDRGQQRGPVRAEDLAGWILAARLPRDVQVWRAGLDRWISADAMPEITERLLPTGLFLAAATGPQGPLDPRSVIEMARAGRIGRETLVWREGLPEWITAGAVPELAPWLPPAPGAYAASAAAAPAAFATVPAQDVSVTERPATDRDGPCPLCGNAEKMGPRARLMYDHWVCRSCHTGLANRRQAAFAIDLVALWLVILACGFSLGIVGAVAGVDIEAPATVLAWLLYGLFLFKDGFHGLSPGKALMGVRVVDAVTGAPAGLGASFKRNLPLMIPFVPLIVAFQVGSGRRLGDGWAGTRVVWEKHRGRGPF